MMSPRDPLWRRYLRLFGPDPRDDVDAELAFHLEELRRDFEAQGLPPAEAEGRARAKFGDIMAVRRTLHARSERRQRWHDRGDWWRGLAGDLRLALRKLRREPGFSFAAILMLALGIGANTAIFSIVNGVLLRPLSYRDPGRLYVVREVVPQMAQMYRTLPANLPNFRTWQQDVRSFESVAIAEGTTAIMRTDAGSVRLEGVQVSSNLFTTLGVAPRLGRTFRSQEDAPGRNHVIVLTDAAWRGRFHADPRIVGTTVTLDGIPHTIVGVMPASFHFPRGEQFGPLTQFGMTLEFFRPLGLDANDYGPVGEFDYAAIARLRPGVTPERALAELNTVQARIARDAGHQVDLKAELWPLDRLVVGPSHTALLLLLAGVIAVLVVLCANLAGLLLARIPARLREAAIRTALGASRRRLIRQIMIESTSLAAIGGALGLALAFAGLHTLLALAPATLPRIDEVRIDGRVLLFGVGLSLAVGALLGALPAWRMARIREAGALHASSLRATAGKPVRHLRDALIGFEVATSTLLLIVALLLSVSLYRVLDVSTGIHADHALAVDLSLVPASFPDASSRQRFLDRALTAVTAIPGVKASGWVSRLPLRGETSVSPVSVPGQSYQGLPPMANYRIAVGDYFRAAGIALHAGRLFEPGDDNRLVAVISQSVADKLWPGRNPIGQVVHTDWAGEQDREVIGVVGDVRALGLDAPPALMVYLQRTAPAMGYVGGGTVVVRTTQPPTAVAAQVRRVVNALDPGVAVTGVQPMADVVSGTVEGRRFQAVLALAFALTANLVAALGIFGVLAYAVEQRRHELGIRMALGAAPAALRWMVVRQGLLPVAVGLAVGTAGTIGLSGPVKGLLFGVDPRDPRIITAALLLTLAVAFAACWRPGRRATRVDPVVVWRSGD